MQLLTAELRAQLPPLYSQDGSDNPAVYIKYFTPDSGWAWYVTEGSPEEGDFKFFGYVVGPFPEWGHFLLSELETSTGPNGMHIEREIHFQPAPFSEVKKRERLEVADEEEGCGCFAQ